jgi:hypothetical protein
LAASDAVLTQVPLQAWVGAVQFGAPVVPLVPLTPSPSSDDCDTSVQEAATSRPTSREN